jgi:phage anti-repressor protein
MRLFGNDTVNSVSLREIYLDLGYKDVDFTTWCKRNLLEDFEENSDFVCKQNNENSGLGKQKVDYLVTLDTAKELAMMSKKPKGKLIRKYFIDVEKLTRSKQIDTVELVEARILEKITDALIDTKYKLEANQQLRIESAQLAKISDKEPEMVEAIEYIEEKKEFTKSKVTRAKNTQSRFYGMPTTNIFDLPLEDGTEGIVVFEYHSPTRCGMKLQKANQVFLIPLPKWSKDLLDFSFLKAEIRYSRSNKKARFDLIRVMEKN